VNTIQKTRLELSEPVDNQARLTGKLAAAKAEVDSLLANGVADRARMSD
jgi:hypothetical protein